MTDFTETTRSHMAGLDLAARKKLGQYMTPQSLGKHMVSRFVTPKPGSLLLDPAVGTGELLVAADKTFPGVFTMFGWDVDENMLGVAGVNVPGVETQVRSLFTPLPAELVGTFDYIIGNPPYFELKKTDPQLVGCDLATVNEKGRLNIYALFFEYALKLLKPGGEMVFLVPPSMNNGAFFVETRKNILTHARINSIEVVRENDRFEDAQTSVQIIHLTRTTVGYEGNLAASADWVVDFNTLTGTEVSGVRLPVIFTAHKNTIVDAWAGRKNLHQLGYTVSTGKQPWNLVKNLFLPVLDDTTPPANSIPLVYSKDITVDNQVSLVKKMSKQRFLPASFPKKQVGEKIIVNRIVGGLHNPGLKFAVIDFPGGYVTENHVNVVEPSEDPQVPLTVVADRLKNTEQWLPEYLKALTGNTQLSGKELQYLIPL